jgi:hypothetical protein
MTNAAITRTAAQITERRRRGAKGKDPVCLGDRDSLPTATASPGRSRVGAIDRVITQHSDRPRDGLFKRDRACVELNDGNGLLGQAPQSKGPCGDAYPPGDIGR